MRTQQRLAYLEPRYWFQILFSKRNHVALEKVLISRPVAGKVEDTPRISCGARIVKMHLRNDGAMSKELSSQPGGAPNGQSWNDLSDKINNDSIKF